MVDHRGGVDDNLIVTVRVCGVLLRDELKQLCRQPRAVRLLRPDVGVRVARPRLRRASRHARRFAACSMGGWCVSVPRFVLIVAAALVHRPAVSRVPAAYADAARVEHQAAAGPVRGSVPRADEGRRPTISEVVRVRAAGAHAPRLPWIGHVVKYSHEAACARHVDFIAAATAAATGLSGYSRMRWLLVARARESRCSKGRGAAVSHHTADHVDGWWRRWR